MQGQKYKVFVNDNVIYFDEKSFKEFSSRFTVVEAAGGLVRNNSGQYLFIFRRGKWDLPKGKADEGESAEQTALREVKEECGLNDLKIIEAELPSTYHSFPEKGKNILKHTRWFLMQTKQAKVTLQAEEDIEAHKWLKKEEIFSFVEGKMYASLVEMLREVQLK